MIRRKQLQKNRVEFVKLAINNPKEAAKELEQMAEALKNTRTTNDIIYALTNIIHVSERTILRDFKNDIL